MRVRIIKSTFQRFYSSSIANNVPENIQKKVGTNLHRVKNHPLNLIKTRIENVFSNYVAFDDLDPVVSIQSNFDDLLTPKDHVSRSKSDTFYIDENTVLRTHTSAHQTELIRAGHDRFLCTGDVYRRDTVDASHYPVFHQMEGVRVFKHDEIDPRSDRESAVQEVSEHLQSRLERMVRSVFGDVEVRWVDAYFPFTEPSYEMEIYFQDEWLEVLGCGVIEQDILRRAGRGEEIGWAFGLGLERLAMVLYVFSERLFRRE